MSDKVKTRPEDQPLPIGNDLPHTHDLAAEDLASRKKLGVSRYGQPLQPCNGRDAVQDLYEEVLDAAAYAAQVTWELEHPEETYVGCLVVAALTHQPIDFGERWVPPSVQRLITEVINGYFEEGPPQPSDQ